MKDELNKLLENSCFRTNEIELINKIADELDTDELQELIEELELQHQEREILASRQTRQLLEILEKKATE